MGSDKESMAFIQDEVEDALRVKDNFAKYKDIKSILIKGDDTYVPKVSICIPTYKRVDTLHDTIKSCLAQVGFEDYSIIVSDNNPERGDETEQYINQLTDSRVLYYKHEANIGMYGNLNRLYELSKSEYTVCIHDDDILFPHFLQVCFNIISSNNNIDILYPDKVIWMSDSCTPPIETLPRKSLLFKMSYFDFIADNPCQPTGLVIKTSIMRKSGGYDNNTYPSNDLYFNVKALSCCSIYKLCCGLYAYRMGANTTIKKDTILGFMRVDPPLIRYLLKKHGLLRYTYSYFMLSYSYYWVNYFRNNHPKDEIVNVDNDIITHFTNYSVKKMTAFVKIWSRIKQVRHYLDGKMVYVETHR